MARGRQNVVPINQGSSNEGDGGDHDGGRTVKAITQKEFATLVKRTNAARHDMDAGRQALGELIAAAVADKHLHKGAFGIYRRIDKMDPSKRAELLFHLDTYRKWADWDTSDMFDDRDGEAAE